MDSLSSRLSQIACDLDAMAGRLRMAGTDFDETFVRRIVDVKYLDRAAALAGMAARCHAWAREMERE